MSYRIEAVDTTFEDIQLTIGDLHRAAFGRSAPIPDMEEGWWWIAYHGKDDPVGFCHLAPSLRVPGSGYLSRSGVLKPHRGHGLQRRMVRVRERKARALGYEWLFSDTTDALSSANNLIRCGYTLYTPDPPYAFKNTLYWRKRLLPADCTPTDANDRGTQHG